MFKFKNAFTLAETLIVMGIIGVVAALTLPNLNSSTGDKEKVAKVKKIYQNLSDAHDRAVAVYGPVNTWFINDESAYKRYADRILEFLKVSKYCENNTSGCFTNATPKDLTGSDGHDCWNFYNAGNDYRVILSDGTSVFFHVWDKNCSGLKSPNSPVGDVCGWIAVDIDGPNKGANVLGKDIFKFNISVNSGIFPQYHYSSPNYTAEYDAALTRCISTGEYCSLWVIENDNMDYLKCPEKLSTTVTTCK
ncbi:type II secretion system protein [bacterium]|nr:type II secretion system protein [bacterium]